ncbi:MAG: DUF4340 domain-containing protein [Verrucomicrobia bacterium]|nr:DUF4340 domain-containing protein [Verrucomicrobiota bacterium]
MRLRTTIALIIFTAGLAWFVFRDNTALAPESVGAGQRLFTFDKQQVDSIEITGKDQSVSLQRRGENWWVSAPVEDRANPMPILAVLEILLRLENLATIEPGSFSSDQLKRSGLNGTSMMLTISGAGKKLATCKVGTHTAIENSLYISIPQLKGGDVIHAARLPFAELAKSKESSAKKFDFLTMLQTPAQAWRDPALIRLKADKVKRITFSAGTGLMEFRREAKRTWELAKPFQTRASDGRVNAVLAALLHIEARPAGKIPTAAASTSAVLPAMKVSIEADDLSEPVELSLQPTADPEAEILATVSNRPGSYILPGKAAAVWKLQPNDLRETRLASIDTASVTALRIRNTTQPEIILDKQGETWMLTRFGKIAPANQERVMQLFSELNATQIREFASDAVSNLEPFGLHQPFLELEWRESGKSNLLQFGVSGENRVFCRYDHEPFIYRINPSLLSSIPTDSVKWQNLSVLNLSTLVVRRIVVSEGDSPAVTLDYDPSVNSWKGEIATKDITALIQKEKADALLNKLVSLTAETWVTDRTVGYEALKNPSLTVQISVINPSKPDDPTTAHTLTFVSTNPSRPGAACYGKLDGNPDLFLLSREQYREITAPVVK